MKPKQILLIVTIIGLIAYYFTFDACYRNPEHTITINKKVSHTDVKTVFIPDKIIYKDIHHYFTDSIYEIITKYDTIYKTINDYFAVKNYKDTCLIDSFGYLALDDSISRNQLIYRQYNYDLNIPEIHHFNDRTKFYVGAGVYFNPNNINVSVNAYLSKNKHLFGVGYSSEKEILINYGYCFR